MTTPSIQSLSRNGFLTRSPEGSDFNEVKLVNAIVDLVTNRFRKRDLELNVVAAKLETELRDGAASEFDRKYGQELGEAAVAGFVEGHSNCIVCRQGGEIVYKSFRSLVDPETGRFMPRKVDVGSERYQAARKRMVYIRRADLEDGALVQGIATVGKCEPEAVVAQFKRITGILG
jgi:6-phosphofructokinase